ncbi:hypothetical protein [Arthrobacter sp. Leaf69]|uniref:hypothetical protein n=1 Tax=Arthrobacter sp. Leaf69 TaxID=1736232 RepID=UPI0006FFE3FC|nr:hypothetical protein [Arthrobacter sp. Leaf69]KQN89168.1 hypothetical protein ASE96_06080 [Arthrobacter sp. Leaf69]
MTENQWPQDGSYGTPTATQQTPLRPETTFPPVPNGSGAGTFDDGSTSKTDVARDEAADVKRQAADSAHSVAETAKTEASNVAAEVKTNAKDLLHQAKSDLTDQAGTQQQKVADGLRSISTELHSMATASTEPGVATDLVRQAAERSSAVASWLDGRDPGSLLTEVKSFARQRPGTFLLLAAGAGVLAGRLSRSLSAGAPDTPGTSATRVPDTGTAVPPPPVQMPAPGATTAGYADTNPPNPLHADPLGNGNRQDRWASEPAASDPFGNGDRQDPLRDDPFDGGRR